MTPLDIIRQFQVEGQVLDVTPLGDGFINDTYIAHTAGQSPDYILQRKNHNVFPDVPGMMSNIVAVTEHIKQKVSDPMRETLTVVPALDGRPYWHEPDGGWWAVTVFIPDTITYDRADTPELTRQGGIGIGHFQTLLSDFDKPLVETIKGFHNIRWRFEQWDASILADKAHRVLGLTEEIGWIERLRPDMLRFWSMVEDGTLPLRPTHNDTKISNILFDKATGKALCAIDLDTVMTSTSLNDVGDALRTYTNTGLEDDKDLSKVSMSMDLYKAYIDGYMTERADTLVKAEVDHLAFAGLYLTYEQVLRFLMDYIDGDQYYKIKYADHNLVRTRAQYKLLQSMESQYDRMCSFVDSL